MKGRDMTRCDRQGIVAQHDRFVAGSEADAHFAIDFVFHFAIRAR